MPRYVAIGIDYTRQDIQIMQTRTVNRYSYSDILRLWKILGIGDDLDREPIVALREKIQKRMHRLYGKGKSYEQHMSQIQFITVQKCIRLYPHLREQLKWYDMAYYEWRTKVEEDKMKQQAKRREGVRFVKYSE